MDSDARQALIAGLFALSRIQRGAPNLAEQDDSGDSLVLGIWEEVLSEALPTVTAGEIVAACREIPAAGPFFPAPADFIEQVRQIRRQKALAAAHGASEARRLALPAPDDEAAATARTEALARIHDILVDLTAKLGSQSRVVGRRSVEEMEAEVKRLRALEGKQITP